MASLLGVSSSYFATRGFSIYDSVKRALELGFETVELGAAHRFEPSVWETVKRIKRDFPSKSYTIHSLFPPRKERFWFNASLGLTKENKSVVENLFRAAGLVDRGGKNLLRLRQKPAEGVILHFIFPDTPIARRKQVPSLPDQHQPELLEYR